MSKNKDVTGNPSMIPPELSTLASSMGIETETFVMTLADADLDLVGQAIQETAGLRGYAHCKNVVFARRREASKSLDEYADKRNAMRERKLSHMNNREDGFDPREPYDPLTEARRWKAIWQDTVGRNVVHFRTKEPYGVDDAHDFIIEQSEKESTADAIRNDAERFKSGATDEELKMFVESQTTSTTRQLAMKKDVGWDAVAEFYELHPDYSGLPSEFKDQWLNIVSKSKNRNFKNFTITTEEKFANLFIINQTDFSVEEDA